MLGILPFPEEMTVRLPSIVACHYAQQKTPPQQTSFANVCAWAGENGLMPRL